jgi:MoaA/NifB/PqqE/SkfB family radical SAM enzyme
MPDLSVEITNACNRDCIHCLRDKQEPREHLPLDIFKEILDHAKNYGITQISLTGGEPTLHPFWPELLIALSERKLKFNFVSNGSLFREKALPALSVPIVKRHLESVCLSLDGASEKSHDTLRGNNSFAEVVDAANLCRLKNFPLSFKTVVTNVNKRELTEIALLGSNLGAKQHSFLTLFPTPRLLENELIPSLIETRKIYSFIIGSILPSIKTEIIMEGSWGGDYALFNCNPYQQSYSVDHLGNLIFCCNLSHVYNEEKTLIMGREVLGSVIEDFKKCIISHYELLSLFTTDRLNAKSVSDCLYQYPCIWCHNYFGKLRWIKYYTNSPWIKELFSEH